MIADFDVKMREEAEAKLGAEHDIHMMGDSQAPRNADEAFDPDDRYKPEGTVRLNINKFSEFAQGLPAENAQRLSEPVYIRGMPWKILAIPRDGNRSPPKQTGKCLGFFLQCNGEAANEENWSCQAQAQLRVCSQRPGIDSHQRRISHTFHPKENDWGYSQFISCDTLLDDNNGYIKDDLVILEVDVTADAPHGLHWDSKKHAGFIGLRNQGATCYMNSILQTLFFTHKLRFAVYQMPTHDDDPDNSVALALQRVFYELQFSDSAVGTRKLTKSFGWDAVDSFLQHDVQELCRVLLDNLESKMSNTAVEGTIPKLFKGRMRSYVRCIDVSFESAREESFYDVQLNVKGKRDIIDSFRDYVESEILDGDNMYDAGELGMQKAEKGVKFVSFPPVLHLQLMRFQYDPQLDANVKINDRFEFPEVLRLNEFVDESGEQDDYTYLLQAVLVHTGDFHGGHYVVYINTNLRSPTPRWCKFDDDVVARCPNREATINNYGGDEEGTGRSCSNAYMLVYVQQNKIDEVLCPVQERDIPRHLCQRFQNEKEEEQQRRKEREQATLYCEVTLITDENLVDHHGFDVGDFDLIKAGRCGNTIRMAKVASMRDFYRKVGEVLQLPPSGIRLWKFDVAYGKDEGFNSTLESRRPRILYQQPIDDSLSTAPIFEQKADNVFYVEIGKITELDSAKMLPTKMDLVPYNRDTSIIAFIKRFDPHRRKFIYHGSLIMSVDEQMDSYYPVINEIVGFPKQTELRVYLEIAPDNMCQIRPSDQSIRKDRNLVLDGIILIVEDAAAVPDSNGTQVLFNEMYSRMQVEAVPNLDVYVTPLNTSAEVQFITTQLDSTLYDFCEVLGSKLDYDPRKIVLWRSGAPSDRPGALVSQEDFQRCTMHDVIGLNGNFIHDPRNARPYAVFYSKIPIPASELDNHNHCRVILMDHKFQTKEFSVFPPRDGTVGDIITGAKENFEFSPNGTGILRLVHISNSPSHSRVIQVMDNATLISQLAGKMFCHSITHGTPQASTVMRVEEVPQDQLTVGANEHLLAVAHYEKEPTKMFGVPFFIKIVDGEPFSNIKHRVKEMLDVSDRDFEKFKFSLIINTRIAKELDQSDDVPVNLADLKQNQSPFAAPFLGIDHANKSRPTRTHHAEKAIVIHN